MNEPRALVEHFFRHEFGRLVAVLTRSLGVSSVESIDRAKGNTANGQAMQVPPVVANRKA
jgi:hypothetical protein